VADDARKDRITEAVNADPAGLDRLSTLEAARLMNAEDRKVAEAVGLVLPDVAAAVDQIVARLRTGGRLFYVGTGTSGRLGVLDASECPPTFGVPPDLVQGIIAGGYEACHRATEASEDDAARAREDLAARGVTAADAVVGISASGETPYTVEAVRWSRERGSLAVAVACAPGSALERAAEIAVVPVVGPEALAGSTRLKAGTAQKMVLNMLSTLSLARLGFVIGNRMSHVKTTNRKLAARAARTLAEVCGLGDEEAEAALEAVGGELATAIVMTRAGVTAAEARDLLARSGGSVSRAIGSSPGSHE
jgi:N-acetylmuramic acid 6-phosphate etherase